LFAGTVAALLLGSVVVAAALLRWSPGPRGVPPADTAGPGGVTPSTGTRGAPAPAEPFGILAGDGKPERRFATLPEAVRAAQDGDTIEVRGNGPFVCDPMTVDGRALTIRAADGFRPVIEEAPAAVRAGDRFLSTNARLVLEGLEFRRQGRVMEPPLRPAEMIHSQAAEVRICNCRFLSQQVPGTVSIFADGSPRCDMRNCEFVGSEHGDVGWKAWSGGQLTLDNCLLVGETGLRFHYHSRNGRNVHLQVTRNTFAALWPLWLWLDIAQSPAGEVAPPFHLEVSGNVFNGQNGVFGALQGFPGRGGERLPADEVRPLVQRLCTWREQGNLYPAGVPLLGTNAGDADTWKAVLPGPGDLDAWQEYWGGVGAAPLQGQIAYEGGDVYARSASAPDQLTPADFRLAPGSAGKGAGPGGRDLGADVDLVGPGAAYEKWKQTPAHREWLRGGRNGTAP
jgi:hypothetical protein